ncbi:MAG: MiaB/RimO family radical SAM methylthiotransferase [Coriobacteriia bacterium]
MTEPGRTPVAFRTLGCKVNQVESEDIAADLLGRGATLVPEDEAAVIIVNTCTVTAEADHKARKALRHALGLPHSPIVVVTGCLAAVAGGGLAELSERLIVEVDKEQVALRVAELLDLPDSPHEHAVRAGAHFHSRAMLKVEDGCDNFCTYCIVPHARGVPRSVPLASVVAEATSLVQAGVGELVVTGINVGRYHDPATGADLAALLAAIAATGVPRLRLSSIEPPDVTPEFLVVVAGLPAFAPHLHVPLQSGSDEILAAMGRKYTVADFETFAARAREAIPGIALTTDVLVGFPGESPTHAQKTLATLERIGFAKLHVFRYSRRPGTPAADYPDQVDPREITARATAVRGLGERMAAEWLQSFVGTDVYVLVERVGTGGIEGTTEHYAKARVATSDAPFGEVVAARVTGEGSGMLDAFGKGRPR